MKSRTLRAEIDLPNPDSQLLPGMYAYVKVIIERPGVRALPVSALDLQRRQGLLLDATRTAMRCGPRSQTGVSDGEWIEVTNRRLPADGATRRPIPGCRSTARSR